MPNSPTDAKLEAITRTLADVLFRAPPLVGGFQLTAERRVLAALKDVRDRTAKRCAEIAESEKANAYATGCEGDRAYNAACDDITGSIRKEFNL